MMAKKGNQITFTTEMSFTATRATLVRAVILPALSTKSRISVGNNYTKVGAGAATGSSFSIRLIQLNRHKDGKGLMKNMKETFQIRTP